MTDNLQLTPQEIQDAYVAALARKAKSAEPAAPTVKKSCGSIGYTESVGENGEIVKSWVFDSHYGGRFTRVGGWATAEDAERALLAHIRSIQAAPHRTHSVAVPPPVTKTRILHTLDHIKHGRCPRCGSNTISSMFGMYEECSAEGAGCYWWNSPPVGCASDSYTSAVGSTVTRVWCDGHDYRWRMCCAAWASGLWSACIGEPIVDHRLGANAAIENAWRGGFNRGVALLNRDVDRSWDRQETFCDTDDDVRRLNKHLSQMLAAPPPADDATD